MTEKLERWRRHHQSQFEFHHGQLVKEITFDIRRGETISAYGAFGKWLKTITQNEFSHVSKNE